MGTYCHKFYTIRENSVLQKFIGVMHRTAYEDQKQMPNPTVIDSDVIVFTAYLKEQYSSKHWTLGLSANEVEDNWYPTIFFYDLPSKRQESLQLTTTTC